MKHKKILLRLCCLLLLLSMMPISVFAANPPSQAGTRKLEGGQRDFAWPVPGRYNLTSCFLDNRAHYSLDIDGEIGDAVVASYAGKVIEIYTGCSHNYGKENGKSCCSSWGNFVLLQHSYTLKNGSIITLYSRYAHLTKVSVKVGQTVARGEKVGTVGSTGRSSGSHLDYEILYGGTSPSSTYSVDPYINDLLELPEELHTTFGKCCQEYVAYVKQLYPRCTHSQYDSKGACADCGYVYDWKTTRDIDAMGYYTASADTQGFSIPYSQSSGIALAAGQKLHVKATVVNGLGQVWYEIALEDGSLVYALAADLVFQDYFASQIQLSDCTVKDGMTLQQQSYRLDGKVTSTYPLRSIVGYLDGTQYASWKGTGGVREISLRSTVLNDKLSFANMQPGQHTLSIFVTDSTGKEATKVYECTFVVEKTVVTCTVSYTTDTETITKTLESGQILGELPVLSREGWIFLGWYTEDGQQVTAETVITSNMQLQPKWEEIPVETEPTIPTESTVATEPASSEEPTQVTTFAQAEETAPGEKPQNRSYLWIIPVVLAVLGGTAGVIVVVQKKKSEKALF